MSASDVLSRDGDRALALPISLVAFLKMPVFAFPNIERENHSDRRFLQQHETH